MRALERKLLRDLRGMWGQALAIALVIVSGVATFVMSLSTLDSLRRTQESFYREYRFAEVFSSLKRAPEGLAMRIREIPGAGVVETRVVAAATLDIPDFPEPARGRIVSIPEGGQPALNRLFLRAGRLPAPGRDDEVALSEPFAEAHGLSPGEVLGAIIHGRRKTLTVVGIANSPEYVYQIGPGALFPDYERFGVLWMARRPLAAASDMEGAFNDVVLSLSPGGVQETVIDRLDALLLPYGGLGAYGRDDQLSHRFLTEELRGLETLAVLFPAIFLGVAAFLLNVVVSRTIGLQREQIAALRAFGYSTSSVGLHYVMLVMLIVLAGAAGGLVAGIRLGQGMSGIYMRFYHFPYLEYVLRPGVAVGAVLVSAGAALLGTLHAVLAAVRLPPAEAMRPAAPERFRKTAIERTGLGRFLSHPARMIARHIGRRPVKSLLSVMGIAFAGAILMVGRFQGDAIDFMVDVEFRLARRDDVAVTFVEPTSRKGLHALTSLEGVLSGEPFRSVPVRLRFGHRHERIAIEGLAPDGRLRRLLDTDLDPVTLPPDGIVLGEYLGRSLGVGPGDRLTVEVLEGSRPVREVPVAALVKQYVGIGAYMDLDALNRLMREGDAISGAFLAVDPRHRTAVYEALKEMPRVAGSVVRESAIRSLYETIAETMLVFTFINTILAATVAVGVIYNSARIALSERSRELASLRVLGYTRGEISYILLGELGVLALAAVPLGFLIGRGLCAFIAARFETDLYRIPLVVEANTYGFSAAVVLASAVLSGLIVRRRLDRLDLVAVLKMRE
jgi:putative ABC transport system permease protein